ncbi:uncharacterized protein BXZ73DRAFT_46610 [Epithele typhae]|uniref:uncharacterized protein n=1 Tax=Epithele typhae TaxID=378194 RepID=UPI0020072BE6|nr:uncharacterized protein BXZ73DRAFT_46610 [Epithele typhae]KAH9933157.1 hypothetical protein BXZ73DRAFT_46610 [Epithele typhae]
MKTPEEEVDRTYISLFCETVQDFHHHLAGKHDTDQLPRSRQPPNAYWSKAEKDLFFRALSIHSRLRPDLIAQEVKTKSVPDVYTYILQLQQAVQDVGNGVLKAPPALERDDFPAAIESSADFLAFEEQAAQSMIALAPVMGAEDLNKERDDHSRAFRASLVPLDHEHSSHRDREGERRRREQLDLWVRERRARWEVEDMLCSLDKDGLAALDRLLREDEEEEWTGGEKGGGKVESEPPENMMLVDEHDPLFAGSFSDPLQGNGAVEVKQMTEDSLIDPLLLAVSGITPKAASPQVQTNASQPHTPSLPEPPLLPPLALNTSSTLFHENSVANTGAEDQDVSQMSPTSRRRYRKRLHMRRKRAKAAGVDADEDVSRMKPGRKAKRRPSQARASTSRSRATSLAPDDTDDEDDDAAEDTRHPHISGATRTYKRQMQFLSMGITPDRLRQEGLGLFHFGGFMRLMRTYNRLHDVPKQVVSQISAETLSLLYSLVVTFVAQVMSRTITWREQERLAKMQTKVWRQKDNQARDIYGTHVKHALTLYGAEFLDKDAHFAGLLASFDSPSDEDDAQFPVSDHGSCSRSVDDNDPETGTVDEGSTASSSLSLLRTIFPPIYHLPSSIHPSDPKSTAADGVVPATFMPWLAAPAVGEPPHEDDLLSVDFPQQDMEAELDEEDELDAADCHADKVAHHAFDVRRKRHSMAERADRDGNGKEDEGLGPTAVRRPRKRRRTRATSQVRGQDKDVGDGGGGSATGADADGDPDPASEEAVKVKVRRPPPRKGLQRSKRKVKSKEVIEDSDAEAASESEPDRKV